ncbi:MAG TPA: glycosyltransferase, partial [Devosia sp.]|nr:glycosyltransferase [Devosia sp.]
MRPRIVLATESLDPSGMGQHMLTLGEAVAGEFDVTLAAPSADGGATLLRSAAERGLGVKSLEPGFGDWLRAFAPALIHVHAGIGWEGHGLVRSASAAGVPVVRTEHLPYLITSVVQQAEYRAMLLSVHQRIAVSQAVADSHRGRGAGRLKVVPNGIAPQAAQRSRAETRKALGIADDEPMVLTVARFAPQKAHDLLLAAVPAVLADFPRARFVLVGTGPEEDAIRAKVEE